jgi:hypothetical protein
MKTYALVAIILIAIGIVAFAYQGIAYTTGEKAVDLGPSLMTTTKATIPLLPMGGALALLAGISLLVIGERETDGPQYLSPKRR